MGEEEKLYISQMENWIKEQDVLENQIRRTIEHHDSLAASHVRVANLNREQLRHHRKRVAFGKREFENWKKDNNIKGENV